MNTALKIFGLIEHGKAKDLQALVRRDRRAARARNDSGQSPIIFAQYQKRKALAEILSTAQPFTDIGEAAALGQAERIRQILEIEPELMDSAVYDGLTPLHLAARFGQANAVEVLLELGSSITSVAKNESGLLPIHCGVQSKDLMTVEVLLDCDAMANATDHYGRTPLHHAVNAEAPEVLQVLLKYGADPHKPAHDGLSPVELTVGDTRKIIEGCNRIFLSVIT